MDSQEQVSPSELDDLVAKASFEWSLVDRSVLFHPVLLRAIAGATGVLIFLVWPELGEAALTRLVGLVLLVTGLTGLFAALRTRHRDVLAVFGSVAIVAVGGYLVAVARLRPDALGRILGTVVVLVALRDLVSAWAQGRDRMLVAKGVLMLVAGGALIVFTDSLLKLVAIGFGTGWFLLGIAAISITLNPNTPTAAAYGNSHELLEAWFQDRPKRSDSRQLLYDKILFEGDDTGRRVIRFVVLMSFASVIAAMGVITDSTAVVIGAMLIAPLMTPLMGMAISLVMGWPRRLARSTLMAAIGIAIAVLIGVLLGLIVPAVIDTSTNAQILARSTPTMLDLIIAVAAGAAGGYALSRPDVSDSLPGVAIAIALVPPLSVVGISYSQGDWSAGNGALLLYATNMVAILVMGGITFIVTGVTPISRVTENQHRMRTWGMALGASTVLVVGALFLNGEQVTSDVFAQDSLEAVIEQWIEPFENHSVVRSSISDDVVSAAIIGPTEDVPTAQSLASLLSIEFDHEMTADVRLIVEERYIATSDPSGS